MEELEELRQSMGSRRPAAWEELPDLALYMDQVIGYMPRQLIRYGQEELLTPAMVNNYIKDGLLPRAEGKRYSRDHLAYLTAICALKQVLPVRDAGLLAAPGEGQTVEESYRDFRDQLDRALTAAAAEVEEVSPEELPRLALALALRSYADKLACQRVVELIRASAPEGDKRTHKKEKR